jgi:hypothetical protein
MRSVCSSGDVACKGSNSVIGAAIVSAIRKIGSCAKDVDPHGIEPVSLAIIEIFRSVRCGDHHGQRLGSVADDQERDIVRVH